MFKTDYPFWVVFLLMEWKTLWLCWLCWTSPSSSFLQTCWREWLQVVIVPSDACLHMLPLPLSAAWEDDDRTTEKLARWTLAQKPRFHEVSGQVFQHFGDFIFCRKDTVRMQTFQQEPSPLEFAFAFLAGFPLANTLSTGPARLCCHKTHILFCRAAQIGPHECHVSGSSFLSDSWGTRRRETRKIANASKKFICKYIYCYFTHQTI